jgi:hypothetical protein
MYGITIHAAIDGGTHFVLWADVTDNKKMETIWRGFAKAVQRFGYPSRMRADRAGEFGLIREEMERVRGQNRGSFIAGSSQNNQRIEHFWRFLFEKVIVYYKHALLELEDEGVLDRDNPLHINALLTVFIPRIQEDIDDWIDTWNLHKVRAINDHGRHLASHVPAERFRPWERERG